MVDVEPHVVHVRRRFRENWSHRSFNPWRLLILHIHSSSTSNSAWAIWSSARSIWYSISSRSESLKVPWALSPSAPGWCQPSWKMPSPCHSILLQLRHSGNTSTVPFVWIGTFPWLRRLPIGQACCGCSCNGFRHDHTSIATCHHQSWPWSRSFSRCLPNSLRRPGYQIEYHETWGPYRATQRSVLLPSCQRFGSPRPSSRRSSLRPTRGMDESLWWGMRTISRHELSHSPPMRRLASRSFSSGRLHRGTPGPWSRSWNCWCRWPWRHSPFHQARIGCWSFLLHSSCTCRRGRWSRWSCRTWTSLPTHLSPCAPMAFPQWSHRYLTSGLSSTFHSRDRWPAHHHHVDHDCHGPNRQIVLVQHPPTLHGCIVDPQPFQVAEGVGCLSYLSGVCEPKA